MDEEAAGREIAHVATEIALASLLRAVIGEVVFTEDRAEFRRRLAALEAAAVDSLGERKFWEKADDQTNELVKDIAQGFVSKVIASIIHPDDAPGHKRS